MTIAGKTRSLRRLLTAAGLVLVFFPVILTGQGADPPAAPNPPSSRKKPEEFKNGIKAQDRGDWKGSVPLMQQSLKKLPEDGQLVRIYGTKYKNYLPHYFLGLALYKQNNCAAAVQEWERCLALGMVRETEEHQALLRYLSECRGNR